MVVYVTFLFVHYEIGHMNKTNLKRGLGSWFKVWGLIFMVYVRGLGISIQTQGLSLSFLKDVTSQSCV
jgi:hypothetical protein